MGINNPLSAIRYRLSAAGYRLPASGVPSAIPPSPLRGPLPPDKQWGAREYTGMASGCRLSASGSRQLTADSGKLIKEYTYNESSCNRSDRSAWL